MLITPECSQDGSSSPTRHPREQSHYPLAFRHYYSSSPLLACTDTDRRATGVQVICSGHRCFSSSSQPTQDTLPSERQQKSLSFLLLSLFSNTRTDTSTPRPPSRNHCSPYNEGFSQRNASARQTAPCVSARRWEARDCVLSLPVASPTCSPQPCLFFSTASPALTKDEVGS